MLMLPIFSHAATITVTDDGDTGPGTLRQAVLDASNGDIIVFNNSISEIKPTSGQININHNITIDGSAGVGGKVTINGIDDVGSNSRIFFIAAGKTVTISNMDFLNAGEQNSTTLWGGAIRSNGVQLTLESCSFKDCNAYIGGAIRIQEGGLTMHDCIFIDNTSAILGGAINTRGTDHYAYNCAFVDNDSGTSGGAIQNEIATWHIYNSTFVGNDAVSSGGGLNNFATIDSLVNCIFYDNTAGTGGADISSTAANINVGTHNLLQNYGGSGLTLNQDNNITGDPLLTNDYELSDMTSPAVNAGTTYSDLPNTDIDGDDRNNNCVPDLGCIEYQGVNIDHIITVTNKNDSGIGSLRDVVLCATSGDTITFDHSTGMVDDTIKLLSSITIDKNLTFLGIDSSLTIIDGSSGDNFSLFLLRNSAEVEFRDMTFTHGGGVSTQRGGAIETSDDNNSSNINKLDLVRCSFKNNEVEIAGGFGGAIYSYLSNTKIVNSYFSENAANNNCGGAIHHEGSGYTLGLVNCIFDSNKAGICGGAVNLEAFSTANITNCTFVNNEQTDVSGGGGAISLAGTSGSLYNNIFRNNMAAGLGSDVELHSGTITAHNNFLTDYSDSGITQGVDGNISGDPLFVDEAAGDYRLQLSSPCKNTGDNTYIPTDVLDVDDDGDETEVIDIDYAGEIRVLGCGTSTVDMGAYETFEGNGIVTTTADDGIGSLRYSVAAACSGDTITFDPSINTQLIQLTTGQITLDKDLTIIGNGIANTIIDGSMDSNSRLLQVNLGSTVHFEELTMQYGGGMNYTGSGAGIVGNGMISMLNCKFSNNNNTNFGCAIFNDNGDMTIVNCEFSDNGLLDSGANESVIWKQGTGSLYIYQSLFTGNDVHRLIIETGAEFDFSQNTVSGNTLVERILQVSSGTIDIHNNILNDNIDPIIKFQTGTISATHNISRLADPLLPPSDNNIEGDALLNTDLSLMTGSSAIGAGDNASIPIDVLDIDKDTDVIETLPQDYIGGLRQCGGTVDMGAFEVNGTVTGTLTVINTDDSGPGSLRDAVACAASGATITFDHSAGMVDDTIKLLSSITIDKNLTFLGIDSSLTIIDGSMGDNFSLFLLRNSAEVEFRDMTFTHGGGANTQFGGAIETYDSNNSSNLNKLDIVSCAFKNNEVGTVSGFGGAIISNYCDTRIVNSYFFENAAAPNANCGGAIHHARFGHTLDLVNCIFDSNKARICGGAVNIVSSSIGNITNCTFIDNEQMGNTSTFGGGAIFGLSADVELNNNIFRNNSAVGSAGGNDILLNPNSTITAHNNLLTDYADSGVTQGVDGNISGDPLFVDEAGGDYRLQSGSPCINTGSNTYIPTDVLDVDDDADMTEKIDIDIQGALREMDAITDMGAYELNGGDCETAVRLSCGDMLSGNASWQGHEAESLEDCDFGGTFNYYQTSWFRFTGTGDSIKLKISDYNPQLPPGLTLEMHLYSGSCGTLSCEAGKYFIEPMADSISITTVVGIEYYLMLGIYINDASLDIGDYTISMECLCGNDPLTYSPPQNFINGDDQDIITDNTITADNLIGVGADILYDGEQSVTLNGGFEVKQGAVFLAKTDGCP